MTNILALRGPFFAAHTLIFLTTLGILGVFLLLYYLTRRYRIFHPTDRRFPRWSTPALVLLVSLLNLFYIGFFFWHHQPQILTITFTFFVLIGLFYNIWYGYLFIIPIIIAWLITANHLGYDAWWNGIFFLILATNWLILAACRLLKLTNWWEIVVAKLLNLGVDLWIIFLILRDHGMPWFACVLTFNTLIFLLAWLIFTRFRTICDHLERLNQNIIYDEEYFVNHTYAHRFIHDRIRRANTRIAFIIMFNFINVEDIAVAFGNYATIQIKQGIMRALTDLFADETPLFYRTAAGEYACFLPVNDFAVDNLECIYNRHLDPHLARIFATLSAVPDQVNQGGTWCTTRINTAVGLYGIQSCDLDEIEDACRRNLANAPHTGANILEVNDPRKTTFAYYPHAAYQTLRAFLPRRDLYITFTHRDQVYTPRANCAIQGLFDYAAICARGAQAGVAILTQRFLARAILDAFVHMAPPPDAQLRLPYPAAFVADAAFVPAFVANRIHDAGLQMTQIIWDLVGTAPTDSHLEENVHRLVALGSLVTFS